MAIAVEKAIRVHAVITALAGPAVAVVQCHLVLPDDRAAQGGDDLAVNGGVLAPAGRPAPRRRAAVRDQARYARSPGA